MTNRVYLDHAATTALVPAAIEAITRELARLGNPSSLHGSGRDARRVVEESREAVAAAFGAHPTEVIFTAGGTEADNLAIKGGFWAARSADPARNRVAISAIEHHAVLESADWLGREQGAVVDVLPVDAEGRVDPGAVGGQDTALVSVIWANNEIGTVQPVPAIAEAAHRIGALAHSDGVQAAGTLPVDFAASGLDLLTVTGHKLGGPVGVGALFARRELTLTPVLHGGGQERDVRSGTLDVPSVAGFAAAVDASIADRADHAVRLRALRDRLTAGLATLPGVRVNGPTAPDEVLPGIVNASFDGCDADAIVLLLDQAGIDASAGAACSAGVTEPSHVLLAMGRTPAEARSAVRFSFGRTTSDVDLDRLLAVLPDIVVRARAAGSLSSW
ncbi:cysteine desulfurase family protein [Microlunatus parietis]|uniref:cysteine desulfurase n=1 Tax=Microlunatus parietis TaxID=682979 RepID=A0A7Y9I2X1_9ACTN|nr:cysteine desulfurase family protein [Microlunatus parietis]NYE69258.1 cysteine desulfurase [Microlunatus parietis]